MNRASPAPLARALTIMLAAALSVLTADAAQPRTAEYTALTDPHASSRQMEGTHARGINTQGDIVGDFYAGPGSAGFLLHQGRYTTLNDPAAANEALAGTTASGINAAGDIVGYYVDSHTSHGFLLRRGRYTTLDDPAGETEAWGINAEDDVVGFYGNHSRPSHGFLLHRGHYTTLEAPGAGSADFQGTVATGINARGDIVGYYTDAKNVEHGFFLHAGHYSTLDDPRASRSEFNGTEANGINDQGDIVGVYRDSHDRAHGFLLHRGRYTTLDAPHASQGTTYAYAVNDRGTIVGDYLDTNNIDRGFALGAIPRIPAQPALRIALGAPKSGIDSVWPLSETGCESIGHGDTFCEYRVQYHGSAFQVGVSFHGSEGANEFDVEFDLDVYAPPGWSPGESFHAPNPGAAIYGQFLNGLIPAGARKTACRYYTHLRPESTAKYTVKAEACLYSYKRTSVLLLHLLSRPSNAGWVGQVALGKTFSSLSSPPLEDAPPS